MKTIPSFVLLALVALLPACSTYKLQGVVVYGARSGVQVVESDDPRLIKGSPIEEAAVMVTLDPNTLRPKFLGQAFPNEKGEFSMAIDEPGAGVLEYEVHIVGSAPGYNDAPTTIPLPGSGKRLLITLAPGTRRATQPDRLLEEFERNKRQFQ